MNKELIEKYEKLGWTFDLTDSLAIYFTSPRVKELTILCSQKYNFNENWLLTTEREIVLINMTDNINEQLDKITSDIINQQRILMEKGLEPEKLIKVSFDVEFK